MVGCHENTLVWGEDGEEWIDSRKIAIALVAHEAWTTTIYLQALTPAGSTFASVGCRACCQCCCRRGCHSGYWCLALHHQTLRPISTPDMISGRKTGRWSAWWIITTYSFQTCRCNCLISPLHSNMDAFRSIAFKYLISCAYDSPELTTVIGSEHSFWWNSKFFSYFLSKLRLKVRGN